MQQPKLRSPAYLPLALVAATVGLTLWSGYRIATLPPPYAAPATRPALVSPADANVLEAGKLILAGNDALARGNDMRARLDYDMAAALCRRGNDPRLVAKLPGLEASITSIDAKYKAVEAARKVAVMPTARTKPTAPVIEDKPAEKSRVFTDLGD